MIIGDFEILFTLENLSLSVSCQHNSRPVALFNSEGKIELPIKHSKYTYTCKSFDEVIEWVGYIAMKVTRVDEGKKEVSQRLYTIVKNGEEDGDSNG